MRLTRYFLPVMRENPQEAQIPSHRLMLRAGLVRQMSAGIYAWLPLGLRVLKKIENIVRSEQNAAGAVEMLMPTLQPASLWKKSGRYDGYGSEMLRIRDRQKRELLYGPTNEEMITSIAAASPALALGKTLYHIQWKFRDELRPRFGVMRAREFLMKDAYSFDATPQNARNAYNRMFIAYLRSFARMGLSAIPIRAAAGPIGGDMSHEFVVLAPTGESKIFCDKAILEMPLPETEDYQADLNPIVEKWTEPYAADSGKHDAKRFHAEVPAPRRVEARGIEVGHIFFFGDKYSKPLGAHINADDGSKIPFQSGSYGIGLSRLPAAVIEASHDDLGIVWPDPVAPFAAGLVNAQPDNPDACALAEKLYQRLLKAGADVLYDDTSDRAGVKFSRMDLIGLPGQIIVGRQAAENLVEIKRRATGKRETALVEQALALVSKKP